MAEIKSFPNNQDVYVGAEWVMKWLHGRTSGVFGAENNLSVSIVPDSMSVEVSDGVGWLSNANGDGIVFWNDSEQSNGSKLRLTHDVADGVLNRIDRIVVTWETTNYVALPTISILKGIASNMPIPPILTNSTTQRQISIASVKIPAGAISLSASMITDERLNSDVCGIVTETIKVDTSTMQSQFEALLNAIQLELQNLNAGTAALLKTGDTMQGTLDMGDNKITNLATPTDDNDAVPKKYVDDGLNKKLSMELLWRNASPNSEFGVQGIAADTQKYDAVIAKFRYESSDFFDPYPQTSVLCFMYHYAIGTSAYAVTDSAGIVYRIFDVYDGGVWFREGHEVKEGKCHNQYCIPTELYGVKFFGGVSV